jgi:three-Cys-motif partner protein
MPAPNLPEAYILPRPGLDTALSTPPSSPQDDGLPFSIAGPWAEEKYALVSLYDSLFSTGMKNKWDCRVYIDLFSGPGLVRIQDSNKFLWGSPMQAVLVKDMFDVYIFCERVPQYLDALKERVRRHRPSANAYYVAGDCNSQVEEICRHIPKASKNFKVLSFCFVDPFNLGGVKFSTISRIADQFVDFLVLLALHMDANRNERLYTSNKNHRIDEFLGESDWRTSWAKHQSGINFPRFLAEEYAQRMMTLNYLPVPFHSMKPIRSNVKNLPLYHLALFSRSDMAEKYWKEVLKYGTPQRTLFDL